MTFNPRKLWKPKLQMLKEACASCPFRDDNDGEFSAIVRRLCAAEGVRYHLGRVTGARESIRRDAESFGDFSCHHTAYDDHMNLRPFAEHRQCPGAAAYFVASGDKIYGGKS